MSQPDLTLALFPCAPTALLICLFSLTFVRLSKGNNGNSELSVFAGSCDNLVCVSNIEGADHPYSNQIHLYNELVVYEMHAKKDEVYMFLLSGQTENTVGEYTLNVTEHQIPSNDRCTDATTVDTLPVIFEGSTFGATPDFQESICGVNWYTRGVWYRLAGRGTVIRIEYQLYSQGNKGNAELGIFTRALPGNNLESCTDLICVSNIEGADHPYSNQIHLYNELVVHEIFSDQNTVYWFLLAGQVFTTVGAYELTLSEYEIPSNDQCEDAKKIDSFPVTQKGSTFGATPDFAHSSDDTCGVNLYTRGVWHRLVGGGTIIRIEYKLFSKGHNGNSELSIFTGSCADLKCVQNVEGVDHIYSSEKNSYNELAIYEMFAMEGEEYSLLLSGEIFDTRGDYELKVSDYKIPSNDRCEDAALIDGVPFTQQGSTAGATPDFTLFDELCGGTIDSRGVWYYFIGRGKVTKFSYSNSINKPQISLYSGACNAPVCEHAGGSGLAQMKFVPIMGKEYRLRLSGTSFGAAGEYGVAVVEYNPPENDSCSNAFKMPSFPFTYNDALTGVTSDFTKDSVQIIDSVQCGDPSLGGTWFSFLGTGSALSFELKTVGADKYFRSQISIFLGLCDEIKCIANKEGKGSGTMLSLAVTTTKEVQYYVLMSSTLYYEEEVQYLLTATELT